MLTFSIYGLAQALSDYTTLFVYYKKKYVRVQQATRLTAGPRWLIVNKVFNFWLCVRGSIISLKISSSGRDIV